MSVKGVCALCAEWGELTFEHIPPRRAFNASSAVAHTLYGLHVGSTYHKSPPPKEGRRGLGKHSLCERCNGVTAAWYGDAFADWTIQCLRYAEKIDAANAVLLSFDLYPLRVLKQILTMLIAVSDVAAAGDRIDALRSFVLSRQSMALPRELQIKAYLNPLDPRRRGNKLLTQNRLCGSCGLLDIRTGTSLFVLGEVGFPPMGYVGIELPPGMQCSADFSELFDISWFSKYHYGEHRTFHLQIPIRRPFGPVPGYYPVLHGPARPSFVDDNHVLVTRK